MELFNIKTSFNDIPILPRKYFFLNQLINKAYCLINRPIAYYDDDKDTEPVSNDPASDFKRLFRSK